MKTMPSMRTIVIFLAAATSLAALAGACSSSGTNPMPGTGGSSIVTTTSSTGTGTPTSSTTSMGTSMATSTSSGMGGSTTSTSTSTGGTGGSCTGAMGCYSCTPMTNEQFLNQCNGQTCQAYNNAQLPGLEADGGLPPLP